MEDFRIFVEGEADLVFIWQYIAFIGGVETNNIDKNKIIQCKGRANLWTNTEILNEIKKAIANDIKPLIIFDADDSAQATRADIMQNLAGKNVDSSQYDLFLFPNNCDSGDLETLLERIIPSQNKPILECWEMYECCLQKHATPKVRSTSQTPLTTPTRKTKIYGYLEALLGTSNREKEKIKEAKRDYHNERHWDLSSANLSPLQQFLQNYL
ncbi:MAG: DUF3226 domain-containing protein [Bacteroides sp.]